jgi:GNAT superfamily N-acetyltransferase
VNPRALISRAHDSLHRLRARREREGTARALVFALWRIQRIRRAVISLEWLLLVERPAEQPALLQRAGVEVRLAVPEDASALARLIDPERVWLRLTHGDVGLVAEYEGRLVGCTWIACGAHRLAGYHVRVKPGPGEVYAYGEIVERELRGRGIGRALLRGEFEEARRRGASTVLAHISLRNPVARYLNFEVFGARVRERILILVLGKRFGVPLARWPAGDERRRRARGPHPTEAEETF